jgi:multidrug efflux pump subunit AcrA (membrane-fusion protein)
MKLGLMRNKILFPILIFLVLFIACVEESATITPNISSISESVYATGFIKSKDQYEVYSKTNGIIEKIFVAEGASVKKGDPIFQIANKNLKIATENARLASLAQDFQKQVDKLHDARIAIELAQKNLMNDSLQYLRQKTLWNQNIGSKAQFEQKELNYEKSKTDVQKAKTYYDDLNRQLKLISDQSKNNLAAAQLLEGDIITRSELEGVLYKLNKKEGESINSQEPFATIGAEEFIIELSIDEADVVKIKKGQQLFIRMDSYPSQVFEAIIVAIQPIMNIRTRTFQVEAHFTLLPEKLYPNLTVEANIVINTKQEALTIPRSYLVNDSCVMLKGGDLQKVEIGLMDYDLVEIKGGIDKNTLISLPQK